MIAAACLATALLLPGGALRARFSCPSHVEVGEPFELEFEISHPADVEVRDLLETPFAFDPSWVSFERTLEPPQPDPADPSRRISRARLRLASLDPGARNLAPSLAEPFPEGRFETLDASAARLEVASVLASGEDAPRPPRGPPPDFGRGAASASSAARWWLAGGATALALLGLALGLLLLRRRRRRAAPAASPLARIAALGEVRGLPPERVRERFSELGALVRAAVDADLPGRRDARTDAEWLLEVRGSGRFAEEALLELEGLFARSEEVKYAGRELSEWAYAELHAHARRALELVAPAAPPARASGAGRAA